MKKMNLTETIENIMEELTKLVVRVKIIEKSIGLELDDKLKIGDEND